MTWCTYARINHHRHCGLVDNNLQEILHTQSLVGADGGSQRHYRSRTSLLKMLAKCRVGLTIRQHYETKLHQLLGSLERLNRVGQQIARIGMNLQFQPVSAECFASHLGCKHSLLGIAHTRCVWQ